MTSHAENASFSVNMSLSSSDVNNSEADDAMHIRQPVHLLVLYATAYLVVFVVGVVGNLLVMYTVYRVAHLHTNTNYFIVNLALADLLVCVFCLPITLLSNLFYGMFV